MNGHVLNFGINMVKEVKVLLWHILQGQNHLYQLASSEHEILVLITLWVSHSLNMHVKLSSETRQEKFGLMFHLLSYLCVKQ